MRRPQGYAVTSEPGRPNVEEDTFTCGHCNSIVFVKPRQDPSTMGGFCRMCMTHICARCAGELTCSPFEKKLEAMERRDRLRRAV
jgi:DNA-directed RNA polymerase subunit RPC12/RpoP